MYRPFTAGELKELVGRKWRYREGTLASEAEAEAERKEAEQYPTQDDIIRLRYKIQ